MLDDDERDPNSEAGGDGRYGRRPTDESFSLFGREIWGWRYAAGDDPGKRAEIRAQKFRLALGTIVSLSLAAGAGPTVLRTLGIG